MKAIGCLGVIVLVVLAILVLSHSSQDATDEQKAQWVGQKAHRGWNRLRELTAHAQEGWKSVPKNAPRSGAEP
jgi:hypothetical protein